MSQFSIEGSKIQEINFYEVFIAQELTSTGNETSIKWSHGINNDDPVPDLDSFEDVTETDTFLSMEKEDEIEKDPLELLPKNIEDQFQVNYSIPSGIKEDHSASIVPSNCISSQCFTSVNKETSKQISPTDIKEFKCHQCDNKTNFNCFTGHVSNKIKSFNGSQCEFKCNSTSQSYLPGHVNIDHEGINTHMCSQCDYRTNFPQNLPVHIKTVHNQFNCSQSDLKFISKSTGTLNRYVNNIHKDIKPFNCSECDYKCSSNSDFNRHKNVVHEKPFNCSQCYYKCGTSFTLTQHVNAVHKRIKPFNCSQCYYKCSTNSALTRHVNAVHKRIRPFNCSQCYYKFGSKSDLNRHVNAIHKGIKPFNCSQCDYKCSPKSSLIQHIKRKHCT